MTTEADRAKAAESAEESAVEKVARALCDGDAEDHDTYTWDEANDELRDDYRRAACHAIGAMKGGSPAEEALRRVEALADRKEREAAAFLGLSGRVGPVNIGSDDLRAALASPAPAPQTGEH